jgi:hypothetical protein
LIKLIEFIELIVDVDSSKLKASGSSRLEVGGLRFEAEKQNAQIYSSEIAEIAGRQPLTSNL